MFDESTIREIVDRAAQHGAPPGVACNLEADLREVMMAHRRRMDRVNRHTQVLGIVTECLGNVTKAADVLEMTREGVYKHLRKSTENCIGVDTKAA